MNQEPEPTLEKLRATRDSIMQERQEFIDSHEPPLSEEESDALSELNRISLEATARYFEEKNRQKDM